VGVIVGVGVFVGFGEGVEKFELLGVAGITCVPVLICFSKGWPNVVTKGLAVVTASGDAALFVLDPVMPVGVISWSCVGVLHATARMGTSHTRARTLFDNLRLFIRVSIS
jgi:hypothetical protein